MELSEAYGILGLAPGVSREEIQDAFRQKTLANLPCRIRPGFQDEDQDEEDRETIIEQAVESMKATINARDTLMKATPHVPETDNEAVLTKDYERESLIDTLAPCEGRFPTSELPNIDTVPGTSTDLDEETLEALHFDMTGITGGRRLEAYVPSEEEYRGMLQDLASLHRQVCMTADTIEKLSRTLPHGKLWNQIWLTLHMAGATTEDAWSIARYAWLKSLRVGKLGPGEWGRLDEFIKSARDTITNCELTLADWNPQQERQYCLKLYSALREFPIAKGKKNDVYWQCQDRIMSVSSHGRFNPGVKWLYSLLMF